MMITGRLQKLHSFSSLTSHGFLKSSIKWPAALVLGIGIGYMAWGQNESVMPLLWLLLIPFVWGAATDRFTVSALMLGYFASGTSTLPTGATVFFGDLAPQWFGWVLWATASVLLTLPFAVLWTNGRYAMMSFIAAVFVSVLPPFGLIGWVNPISVAGVLFPGFGWAGMVLILMLYAALIERRIVVVAVCLVVACASNFFSVSSEPPDNWRGVNTNFAKLSSDGGDDAQQLHASINRVLWLSEFVKDVPAGSVTALPETLIGVYNGLTEYHLFDIESTLREKNARILVGAEVQVPGGKYENTLLILGRSPAEPKFAVQRIPVPISMWRPLASTGAVASIFNPRSSVAIAGRHVGIAICYEQMLPYSLLATLSGETEVLVAASNVWWARFTKIPNIQRQTTHAFARLFAVPVVSAFNI